MAKTAKKVNKSVAPFYGVAALWLVYSFLVGLHRFSDFLIVIALSFGAFWLLGKNDEDAQAQPAEEKKETQLKRFLSVAMRPKTP